MHERHDNDDRYLILETTGTWQDTNSPHIFLGRSGTNWLVVRIGSGAN